jgi:hypothetical protein
LLTVVLNYGLVAAVMDDAPDQERRQPAPKRRPGRPPSK